MGGFVTIDTGDMSENVVGKYFESQKSEAFQEART
jgi:hypothetical protein